MRYGLATLMVVLLLCTAAWAANYSAKTHFYAVEFLKPVAGFGDVCSLYVIFNRTLDAQTAERVLREELQRVVSLFPPPGEVLAYAWRETDSTHGSEQITPLIDGSHFLIYLPKTQQTLTENQYKVPKQRSVETDKRLK